MFRQEFDDTSCLHVSFRGLHGDGKSVDYDKTRWVSVEGVQQFMTI